VAQLVLAKTVTLSNDGALFVSAGSESQSGTLGQVQKSRLLGTQNVGSMNPWSLRSLELRLGVGVVDGDMSIGGVIIVVTQLLLVETVDPYDVHHV
jgi:uncharacterized membrane protein YfcA